MTGFLGRSLIEINQQDADKGFSTYETGPYVAKQILLSTVIFSFFGVSQNSFIKCVNIMLLVADPLTFEIFT